MSRYVILQEDGSEVAYGCDHATGYFFQVFAPEPDENGEDKLLIDEDSMFSNMSNGRMLELMQKYKVPDSHCLSVSLDLQF